MICPGCGSSNSAVQQDNRNWCGRHGAFYCAKCVKLGAHGGGKCPGCKLPAPRGSNFFIVLAALVAVLTLVGAAYFFPDYQLMQRVQAAPLVSPGAAIPGQFVKMFGRIGAPPSTVVISGYNPGGKGGMWSYHFMDFYLISGNSSIYVDMSGVGTEVLGRGPNGTENTVVFSAGDLLALAGTVGTSGSGNVLHAERAADTVGDLYDPTDGLFVAFLIAIGTTAAAAFAFAMIRLRVRLVRHRRQLATQPKAYFQGPALNPPAGG